MKRSSLIVSWVLVSLLAACGSTATEPTLEGTTWQLAEFVGGDGAALAPDNPESYTVVFGDDGTATIVADCNTVLATFASGDSDLTFELGPSTLVACDEGSLSDQYTGWLGNTTSFTFEGDELVLSLSDGAGTLRFTPAG